MNRRTRTWGAVSVALALTALVGCSAPLPDDVATNQNGPQVYGEVVERTVTLQDGRQLECLFWVDPNQNGGVSCDWVNAGER